HDPEPAGLEDLRVVAGPAGDVEEEPARGTQILRHGSYDGRAGAARVVVRPRLLRVVARSLGMARRGHEVLVARLARGRRGREGNVWGHRREAEVGRFAWGEQILERQQHRPEESD